MDGYPRAHSYTRISIIFVGTRETQHGLADTREPKKTTRRTGASGRAGWVGGLCFSVSRACLRLGGGYFATTGSLTDVVCPRLPSSFFANTPHLFWFSSYGTYMHLTDWSKRRILPATVYLGSGETSALCAVAFRRTAPSRRMATEPNRDGWSSLALDCTITIQSNKPKRAIW